MIKLLLLNFILLSSLYAKSNESCYTVQLVSTYNSKSNLSAINNANYPQICKLMEIGKSLTVRCGCFERYVQAKKSLQSYSSYKKAVIATTYKYRFDDTVVEKTILKTYADKISKRPKKLQHKKNKISINKKPVNSRDEELRLILQVFLYKGDLKSAYKVATLGYKEFPNSYYWNEKMADISKWTNRSARAMKHLRFIYEVKYDPAIAEELINYGSASYQYENIEPLVISRAQKNPTKTNVDLMILVFKKTGSPEKVIKVLDAQYAEKKDPYILTKALDLSLEMGDLELAKKYTDILESQKPYTKSDAALISRYYYIAHDTKMAYESLSYVKENEHENKKDHLKYYQLKSDLGWYLQKTTQAALASKHLMDINESRLIDYERISFVYQKTNPKLAAIATKRAYKEYGLSYLFYTYANGAINTKNFNELKELVDSIDESTSPLPKKALFWLIKSKIYAHFKQTELEQQALLTAKEIEPDNFQIKLELLWFYMDINDTNNVSLLLMSMSQSSELQASSYLPMASAYFYLNDIDRASYYTQMLLELEHPATRLLEFKFLQAYIYQIQNNEEAFSSSMHEIVSILKAQVKKNPRLKQQDRYLSIYLRAAMNVLNPDKFERTLKKAKPYLKPSNYDEISYSWAMKNKAYEKTLKIYHRMSKKALWVRFSNATVFQEHSNIEDILELYLHSISVGDGAQAAYNDGQKALAQTITFEGLKHNEKNQNAYIKHLDLSKERSDLLDIKGAYYDRDPLLQKYTTITNTSYLSNSYELYARFDYYRNSILDSTVLAYVPKTKIILKTGLKKMYDRGYLEGFIAYHKSAANYMEYLIDGKYRVSTDIKIGATLGKNIDALDSTQLLIGGKKDMLGADLTWNILNSTSINFLQEFNQYASQDDIDLGSGRYSRVTLSYQIRNGYPDLRLGTFYDAGAYNETPGSRGVIDKIQARNFAVLPVNFYNIGVNLSYGMANSTLYTRVWRPYVELSPYYNSEIDDYTYGINAGYGGKMWHQDHLAIGISYTDSVSGVGGSILEIYFNYKFLYHHP